MITIDDVLTPDQQKALAEFHKLVYDYIQQIIEALHATFSEMHLITMLETDWRDEDFDDGTRLDRVLNALCDWGAAQRSAMGSLD